MSKIQIRVFRAVDDPEACEKFIYGHRKILEIYYGIIKITSDNNAWVKDPNTVVIVAEDPETKKVYGGARVQVFDGQTPLPIDSAVSKYDQSVTDYIQNEYKRGGTCELCGVWNSKEIAGMGVGSHILTKVAVAITSQLHVKSIFVLCAPGTVRIAKKHGFEVVTFLGNNGLFYYPKDDFVATVMEFKDVFDFQNVQEPELSKILLLRNNPDIVVNEAGPKGTFEVIYLMNVANWEKLPAK
ncbi:hypothetical protein A8C56_03445 [Niabella ginsenosidivorans]|uniref:N-acetyltransferase domain-containing protein n=1 Tax=Niabella ginsenosidivorans TaxID=1176587 RepID=A0A1A9IAT4_9BACT|nr:hypothetical protein A8C56_03445 [Niabella ginsenosidivorans]